jgi:peroxiredoxin
VQGGFKNVKLSDYKGKWVVLCFYPGDFTFVWPTELSAVAVKYEELKKLGVEVLAMSVDSRFVHKIWQEQELSKMVPGGVPFPMLSDAGGRIGSVYGVYDEDAGVNIRGRFLIDPDGVVQAITTRSQKSGSKPLWLATRQGDFKTGSEPGGKGVGSLEDGYGLLASPNITGSALELVENDQWLLQYVPLTWRLSLGLSTVILEWEFLNRCRKE